MPSTLELAAPFEQIWAGLARYWRKRTADQSLGGSTRLPPGPSTAGAVMNRSA